ncbi:uncharacterized protein [Nicotiana sylvestris]|uniref:Uncharacterized protein LOC104232465 n=1 Tax=Nicotiana sylvestris TaxID=4096 RepID=A0A1U7XC18_NICSY|nr:PREDICTED: uncharacterized protein LOC104232465 [Nicotiana sylvestris]XP_009783988.1 PREDICTED: uncharacterized protein LOC104232465 [Nicotiana sylvestris]XP_009783995.1 PREDICTED: uncharacterized protein LOC104232465 [Nicotiana sylvestris]XP_009784002.1 PREDICTED: uncharacterized protein LOC104232465 [Nicotiana sylvestris]
MDNFRGFGLGKAFRKQRTNLYRRPQNESQMLLDCPDNSSISSTPQSDSVSRASSHDIVDYGNISGTSYSNLSGTETGMNQGVEDGNSGDFCYSDTEQKDDQIDMNRFSEGYVTASHIEDPQISGTVICNNHSGLHGIVSDGAGNDNKVKTVKLKVGGVTRTIHTSVAGSSSTKSSSSSDAPQPWQPKENTGGHHPSYTGKAIGLRGIPWKDFAKTGFSIRRVDSLQDQLPGQIAPLKQFRKYKAAHKSKPVLKRHLSDDEDDDDDEIRYLEKLKSSKYSAIYSAGYEDVDEPGSKKERKISRVLSQTTDGYGAGISDYNSLKARKGMKKSKSARESQDTDSEEGAVLSDTGLEPMKKQQRKEFIDFSVDGGTKLAVTTRQQAIQTGKDISSSAGLSAIGFPHGLPPPPPKKQKEKLSEVEQQLKKAEAAQRRRTQAEKAARESEAEAIRKILGQDSNRKKREDKLKKRQEELAQERNATATALSSSTIRWVMGPSGNVVTFPNEMGLPSIFEPKAFSYPPPREKCAGPSCMNTYKYRDSKSKLPLCSLQCYRAIREKIQPLSAC